MRLVRKPWMPALVLPLLVGASYYGFSYKVAEAGASGPVLCAFSGASGDLAGGSNAVGFTAVCSAVPGSVQELDASSSGGQVFSIGTDSGAFPSSFTVTCPVGGADSGTYWCGGHGANGSQPYCTGVPCQGSTTLYDLSGQKLSGYGYSGGVGASSFDSSFSPAPDVVGSAFGSLTSQMGGYVGMGAVLVAGLMLLGLGVVVLVRWSRRGVRAA